jgi:hypothetical protein
MLKHYLPHLIFFGVFFAAAVPVLYYIRRKNPNPRFRPGFGEMSVMTLIAAFICGGMAFGLGSLFRSENDGASLKKKPDAGAGWSAGDSGTAQDPGSGKKKSKNRDEDDGGEPPRRRLNDRN